MKEILLACCGAWVFVYVLKFQDFKYKPFNCEVCMAGWFTLLLFLTPEWVEVPFYMSAAMILTIWVTKLMKKA